MPIVCSPEKAGEADGEATDKGGWERYQVDWRNFFECMLAPVARQAAGGPMPRAWSVVPPATPAYAACSTAKPDLCEGGTTYYA